MTTMVNSRGSSPFLYSNGHVNSDLKNSKMTLNGLGIIAKRPSENFFNKFAKTDLDNVSITRSNSPTNTDFSSSTSTTDEIIYITPLKDSCNSNMDSIGTNMDRIVSDSTNTSSGSYTSSNGKNSYLNNSVNRSPCNNVTKFDKRNELVRKSSLVLDSPNSDISNCSRATDIFSNLNLMHSNQSLDSLENQIILTQSKKNILQDNDIGDNDMHIKSHFNSHTALKNLNNCDTYSYSNNHTFTHIHQNNKHNIHNNYNNTNSTNNLTEYDHDTHTQTKYMTPSQKYRLKRQQLKKQIISQALKNDSKNNNSYKNTEKSNFTTSIRSSSNDTRSNEFDIDEIDDAIIWNVPVIAPSTDSLINTNTSKKKITSKSNIKYSQKEARKFCSTKENDRKHKEILNQLPTTKIPGVNNDSMTNDLNDMSLTTQSLTNIYNNYTSQYYNNELMERDNNSNFLPLELQKLDTLGFEDLKLISNEKLDSFCITRPFWLPPKDSSERKNQDSQIYKYFNDNCKNELIEKKWVSEYIKGKNEFEDYLIDLVNNRDSNLSNPSGANAKQIFKRISKNVKRYPLPSKGKYSILSSFVIPPNKFGFESLASIKVKYNNGEVENSKNLNHNLSINDDKDLQISKLIELSIQRKIFNQDLLNLCYEQATNSTVYDNLTFLLKMKSLTSKGIQMGDTLLFYHFLIDNIKQKDNKNNEQRDQMSLDEIWNLNNFLQTICFNGTIRDTYNDKIVRQKKLIRNKNLHKDELDTTNLNFTTWWYIMEHINSEVFMWILDIILVTNLDYKGVLQHNYKILVSLTIDILTNYHFGFNDLTELGANVNRESGGCYHDSDSFHVSFPNTIPGQESRENLGVNYRFTRRWLDIYSEL